jgi:hypothetical protein
MHRGLSGHPTFFILGCFCCTLGFHMKEQLADRGQRIGSGRGLGVGLKSRIMLSETFSADFTSS